jgi:signal transduction histidine kinase
MKFAEQFPEPTFLRRGGSVFILDATKQLYGQYKVLSDHVMLKINDRQKMEHIFADYIQKIESLPAKCRIYDENGNFVAGSDDTDAVYKFTTQLELEHDYLHGWSAEIFVNDSAFKIAADRQIAVYMWTGILVAGLILLSGLFAAQAVRKQVKINKLKNDFIATVTHELKTPLASMRILADTLIEKNYTNEKTPDEYLHLISKENERLSRLIDNFLSFSRMERNKCAFEMAKVSPVEIANTAAQSMQTKFKNRNVSFDLTVTKPINMVYADRDAMITVLVNLLDNACKYSNGDKQIRLNVFHKNGSVCFSVADNGLGIPKRLQRKIFSRFYQVDRSLARKAEGCGLGLSIVKFIIDAHNGKIEVESKVGKGSTFTVTLTAIKNGNSIKN